VSTSIGYLAHASFVVQSPCGIRLMIDPFASRVWLGYDFPVGVDADAVLITHPHADHDGGRRLGLSVPWAPSVPVIDTAGAFVVGDCRVIGIEGKHADPYGKDFGQLNTIMKIEVGGMNIVHLGDNGPLTTENLKSLGFVDILMVPIDAQSHILAACELRELCSALTPRYVIPMHYRIPELERDPDAPAGLGDLAPWLMAQPRVEHVGASSIEVVPRDLPERETVLVLKHSPRITPAGS